MFKLIMILRFKAAEWWETLNQVTCKHSYGKWRDVGSNGRLITQICRCPKCNKFKMRYIPKAEHVPAGK